MVLKTEEYLERGLYFLISVMRRQSKAMKDIILEEEEEQELKEKERRRVRPQSCVLSKDYLMLYISIQF